MANNELYNTAWSHSLLEHGFDVPMVCGRIDIDTGRTPVRLL